MSLTNFQNYTFAYGGFTYDCNGYRIHKFTQNGTFSIVNSGLIDVLVVGGGAGGGVNVGGGAGGVIYQSNISVQLGSINITVGDGGYAYPDTTSGISSSFSNIIAGGGNIGADLYQGGTLGTPQSYLGNQVIIPYGGGGAGASGNNTTSNIFFCTWNDASPACSVLSTQISSMYNSFCTPAVGSYGNVVYYPTLSSGTVTINSRALNIY